MKASLVYMGTPDFAVPPLKALHKQGYTIPLVITQPDRPYGRGRKMKAPPVKETALELGLTVRQPERVNDDSMIEVLRDISPDFFVVVAFGQLLSKAVLSIPKHGPINIHGSLLPYYRGAAPIHRAIVNGEEKTGVTTMFMDTGMDSGDMLDHVTTDILEDDTVESLHDRLSDIGADLIVHTLEGVLAGTLDPEPQDHSRATYAPMLSKNDGLIDWNRPAHDLDCFIRGMTPWPGAFTFFAGKRLKIFKAVPVDITDSSAPGQVLSSSREELIVQTGKEALSILEIQGSSGKRLNIADFLRGFTINKGDVFDPAPS